MSAHERAGADHRRERRHRQRRDGRAALARRDASSGSTSQADEAPACSPATCATQAACERAVAAAVERLGGLDVLINNAGLGDPAERGQGAGRRRAGRARGQPDRAWRVTAAALPHLRASRGRVVNVASGLAHLAVPFATAYCMSKRGAGRLLRRAAARARRRDHRHDRLPRLHPHRHPRRRRGRAASGSRARCRPSGSRTRRRRSRAPRSGARCATSRRRARARSSTSSRAARRGGCSTR